MEKWRIDGYEQGDRACFWVYEFYIHATKDKKNDVQVHVLVHAFGIMYHFILIPIFMEEYQEGCCKSCQHYQDLRNIKRPSPIWKVIKSQIRKWWKGHVAQLVSDGETDCSENEVYQDKHDCGKRFPVFFRKLCTMNSFRWHSNLNFNS